MEIRGTVVLMGRPNVGKSTFFKRLTRKNVIISNRPGVTRDALYGEVPHLEDREQKFRLVDTGGYENLQDKLQPFNENLVWQNTLKALEKADVILLLLDARCGVHPDDHKLLDYLRKQSKPYAICINKADGVATEQMTCDFAALGIEKVWRISSTSGEGLRDLRGHLEGLLSDCPTRKLKTPEGTRIALIGKPNAGKSSLLNRLVREDRALVSEVAGTTRDRVDAVFHDHGDAFVVVDTAGMRRRTKVGENLEKQSVKQSVDSINRAEIVICVIDAIEGMTDQDIRLVTLAISRGKAVLIVVNKWDLVPSKDSKTMQEYAEDLRHSVLKSLRFIPIHFISCKENRRINETVAWLREIKEQMHMRVGTGRFNQFLADVTQVHNPHLVRKTGRRMKFYYGCQLTQSPPSFQIKTNYPDELQESYKKFLIGRIREEFGLRVIPLRLSFSARSQKDKAQA